MSACVQAVVKQQQELVSQLQQLDATLTRTAGRQSSSGVLPVICTSATIGAAVGIAAGVGILLLGLSQSRRST